MLLVRLGDPRGVEVLMGFMIGCDGMGVGLQVFGRQINRVVSHPTLPLTITAHEDRHIRFYDNLTGKLAHTMVAHLDAVTCLAVDPNGLYLLSGSTPTTTWFSRT